MNEAERSRIDELEVMCNDLKLINNDLESRLAKAVGALRVIAREEKNNDNWFKKTGVIIKSSWESVKAFEVLKEIEGP